MEQHLYICWGNESCRSLSGWLLGEWYNSPLYVWLLISVLGWLLGGSATLSILPYLKNWRLVYCWVVWLLRDSNPQNPHESYLLRSILFVSTRIRRIIILLGGTIYWRRRTIFFYSDILCVIFVNIPRTWFYNKKDDASEGVSKLTRKDDASELSSDDMSESDNFEAEVTEDDDLVDD